MHLLLTLRRRAQPMTHCNSQRQVESNSQTPIVRLSKRSFSVSTPCSCFCFIIFDLMLVESIVMLRISQWSSLCVTWLLFWPSSAPRFATSNELGFPSRTQLLLTVPEWINRAKVQYCPPSITDTPVLKFPEDGQLRKSGGGGSCFFHFCCGH